MTFKPTLVAKYRHQNERKPDEGGAGRGRALNPSYRNQAKPPSERPEPIQQAAKPKFVPNWQRQPGPDSADEAEQDNYNEPDNMA